MALNFTKTDTGANPVAPLVGADGQPVAVLDVVLGWDQPGRSGLLGRFKPATDIDVSAIIFCEDEAVDYVSPKEHPVALSGRVKHHGDVRSGSGEGGGERISLRLADLRSEDHDITAIALTASCTKGGFSKIAGAVCRFYNAGTNPENHLDNVRFDVTGSHNGALLGVVRKATDVWQFEKTKAYGPGGDWRALAALAKSHV